MTKQIEPTAAFETITPNMAKTILEKNTKNRKINDENLSGIIFDMNRNNFHLTGESIKIASNGVLLDGQHRLTAIVKNGQPIKILVVRGLDEESFKYIDTGRKRVAADILAIEGIKNPSKIAAMVKFIVNFKNNNYSAVANSKTLRLKSRITNTDVSEFTSKNYVKLEDSYHYGFNKQNNIISSNFLASFHYILSDLDAEKANEFCFKLVDGSDLTKDSSIKLLREKLIADIRSTRKMPRMEKLAIFCKAWNLYRQNKTLSILKWDSLKEPFPKPI